MKLDLGLHVQSFQLGEDLVKVHPVLRQYEHRPVHGNQTDLRGTVGRQIYVDRLAGRTSSLLSPTSTCIGYWATTLNGI